MSHKINHFLKQTIKQKKKTYPLSHYFSTFALHFLTYNKNIKRTTKPDKGLTNRKFNMLSILIPVYNYDCSELIKAIKEIGDMDEAKRIINFEFGRTFTPSLWVTVER